MKDLTFTCKESNGSAAFYAYDTIMDFEKAVEQASEDFLKKTDITATFFENKHNVKQFDTISKLLTHCKEITK